MKVGVYALAKNESSNVEVWERSSRDADVRVVTDTGSTDNTVQLLQAAGVTVARGCPIPWRWDDAHNLSLFHMPADVDVCIRLDLDEELEPGWRVALEAAWKPGITKMRYRYQWSSALQFESDRCHSRDGYRWQGATHEGLVRWSGDELVVFSSEFRIRHHRQPGKQHKSDLTLLQQAVREHPHDARMHWYLAREMDYANNPETEAAFEAYLGMPGGVPTERAYAYRVLAKRQKQKLGTHLLGAMREAPLEPEAYLVFAELAYSQGDMVAALSWARQALMCPVAGMTHASDPRAYSHVPADIASVAASRLRQFDEALEHARVAVARCPDDQRLAANLRYLEQKAQEVGPKAA